MRRDVEFKCVDCEHYSQNKPLAFERDCHFYNLTKAIDHLREYPDHHIEAYVEGGLNQKEHENIINSINPLGQD